MRFSLVTIALLAFVEGGLCDVQESQLKTVSGSPAGRAAAIVRAGVDKTSFKKRQIRFENGGINIGGLQIGGGGNAKAGAGQGQGARNQTANGNAGGLNIGGLQLGGGNNKPAAGAANSALGNFLNAAAGNKNGTATAGNGAGAAAGTGKKAAKENGQGGPGANPGEAAKAELGLGANPGAEAKAGEAGGQEATPAEAGKAEAGQPKAVTESEQFEDNAGITLGADGQARNIGGDLGITKGSDGSTSVGGKSGINIIPKEKRD